MWPGLDALLGEIDAASPGRVRRTSPSSDELVLTPGEAARPLVIAVSCAADGISVAIEGWVQRFAGSRDDHDHDHEGLALDLIAAALFGRLCVRVVRLGDGRVVERRFVFATARGPRVHRHERRWRWPWQRVETSEHVNAVPVPPGRRLGAGGVLPWAPWAGTWTGGDEDPAGPRALPIDGELDLHPFSPRDVKPLVLEYIEACKQRGITELRIVHGKGIGALRRTVHAILQDHPDVAAFRIGGMGEGSWGATLVTLATPQTEAPPGR